MTDGGEVGQNFIYPALQLDHNDPLDNRPISIAGGPVINGEYFYGNFAGSSIAPGGQLYSVALEDLLLQKTSLETGESVNQLTCLDDHNQFMLAFDDDNDPGTDPVMYNTFAELLGHSSLLGEVTFDLAFHHSVSYWSAASKRDPYSSCPTSWRFPRRLHWR